MSFFFWALPRQDLNNLNATRMSVAADGLTEANLYLISRSEMKCKQIWLVAPKNYECECVQDFFFFNIHSSLKMYSGFLESNKE